MKVVCVVKGTSAISKLHACALSYNVCWSSAPGRLLLIVASLCDDVTRVCQSSIPEHSGVVVHVHLQLMALDCYWLCLGVFRT